MIKQNTNVLWLVGILFTLSSLQAKQPTVYKIFDKVGTVADCIIARGNLEKKHQTMFDELVNKLGLTDREIKAKNAGLLPRLLLGYNNSASTEPFNRIYFNQDVLNDMPDEVAKALMANELIHALRHHFFTHYIPAALLEDLINTCMKHFILQSHQHEILLNIPPQLSLAEQYAIGNLRGLNFSKLLISPIIRSTEYQADTEAVTVADIKPETAILLMLFLKNPPTNNWPLYAKIQNFIFNKICMPILSLPLLKQHQTHPTYKERIDNFENLKSKAQDFKF